MLRTGIFSQRTQNRLANFRAFFPNLYDYISAFDDYINRKMRIGDAKLDTAAAETP